TLQTFVRDELLAGSREVGLDDELLMDGYVDSVGVMRLTAFIEESFGLKVPPQDLTIENFRSVNSLSA
ncbi:MAG: acyl carrier protein, partial [Akkermansiaceae bacterium]|nr:acyl carrier protein [Akkermansiaceae bacterium]